ncbi:MAG: PKD domain-containing protein [Bacteroidia bacterium]
MSDTFAVSFASLPLTQVSYIEGTSPLDIIFSSNATNTDSISWDFGDGNSGSGFDPTHTYLQSGNYQVILTAYSPCGTSQDTIDVEAFLISIGDDYLPGVKLWLSQQSLHLEIAQLKASHYELILWDLNGKQITQTKRVETLQSSWSIASLAQGMYLAQLVDPEGKIVYLSKIVKL